MVLRVSALLLIAVALVSLRYSSYVDASPPSRGHDDTTVQVVEKEPFFQCDFLQSRFLADGVAIEVGVQHIEHVSTPASSVLDDLRTLVRLNLGWGELSVWSNKSNEVLVPFPLMKSGTHGLACYVYDSKSGKLMSSEAQPARFIEIGSLPAASTASSAVLTSLPPVFSYSLIVNGGAGGDASGRREEWFEIEATNVDRTIERACQKLGHSVSSEFGMAINKSMREFVQSAMRTRQNLAVRLTDARRQLSWGQVGLVNVIFGAGGLQQEKWISSEQNSWNLLNRQDFVDYLGERPTTATYPVLSAHKDRVPHLEISRALAEHVWEHLSLADAIRAAELVHEFMAIGGRLRVAVPDWWRPGNNANGSSAMLIDDLKFGHTVQYNADSLTAIFQAAGFKVKLLECHGQDGIARTTAPRGGHGATDYWDEVEGGYIERCSRHDARGAYSIVLDAEKVTDHASRTTRISGAPLPPLELYRVAHTATRQQKRDLLIQNPTTGSNLGEWGQVVDESMLLDVRRGYNGLITREEVRHLTQQPKVHILAPQPNSVMSLEWSTTSTSTITTKFQIHTMLSSDSRNGSELLFCWSVDTLVFDDAAATELMPPRCAVKVISTTTPGARCVGVGSHQEVCRVTMGDEIVLPPLTPAAAARSTHFIRLTLQVFDVVQ